MTNRFGYFYLTVLACLLWSCSGNDNEDEYKEYWLVGSQANFNVSASASKISLPTLQALDTWQAHIEYQSGKGWLTLSASHGEAGAVNLRVSVDTNTDNKERIAVVSVSCHNQQIDFTIKQSAAPDVDNPDDPSYPEDPEIKDLISSITATYYKGDMTEDFHEKITFSYENGIITSAIYNTSAPNSEITMSANQENDNKTSYTIIYNKGSKYTIETEKIDGKFVRIGNYTFSYTNNQLMSVSNDKTSWHINWTDNKYMTSITDASDALHSIHCTYNKTFASNSNINLNLLMLNSRNSRNSLKDAFIIESNAFGYMSRALIYKAEESECTYLFNYETDEKGRIVNIMQYNRYNDYDTKFVRNVFLSY